MRLVMAISLGLLFSAAPAAANPMLEVAGPKVGIYVVGAVSTPVGTHFNKLVVSFTTAAPLVDVTIDVGLGDRLGGNAPVLVFLTDKIGPAATVANEIASSSSPYSGSPGEHFAVFHHLNLEAGTYYLVMDAPGGVNAWNRLLPFTVSAETGVTRGNDFYTVYFADYPPAAPYFPNPHTADEGALQYRVLPTNAFVSEMLSKVVAEIVSMNVQAGISNAFDEKLNAVINALDASREQNDGALNMMYAFINAVEVQRGKKLTDAQADSLIADANSIIAILAG